MKNNILPIAIILAVLLGIVVFVMLGVKKPVELVGSWHASPSVTAGYKQRYVFNSDGVYTYYSDESEGKPVESGKWGTLMGYLVLSKEESFMPVMTKIGEVETETDEAIVYPEKMKIGGETYWRYSEDTNIWE